MNGCSDLSELTISLGRLITAMLLVTGSNPYRTNQSSKSRSLFLKVNRFEHDIAAKASQHNGAVAQLVER